MTVPVSSGAISHEELMKSDYIQLEWNSPVWDILPAGAFIEYEGEKYSLLEPYKPTCTNEAEYQYTPQFQSRIMAWDKHPVPLYTYDEEGSVVGREFDWEFTGSPADVLYMVKQAIMHETGEEWTYQLSDSLPATVSLQSQSSSIFSVLSELADLCETEWWVDNKNNFLHLSKCEYGEPVMLTAGQNVKMPSIKNNKDGYYTRFYVFGSTKNITQDYQSGQATNHIVNKRLTLDPLKYPGGFKDIKGHFENGVFVSDLLQGEIFPKTLYFNEVFPSSRLTISNVRPRAKYRLDSNGNKIQIGGSEDEPVYEQYAIWYFRVEGFDFDPQTIIEGTKLSVSFESGQLAGRDFELTYHEKDQTVKDAADVTAFDVKAGDFEIIIDESTGSIIPGAVYIIPQDGDKIVLYNIEMPDEYTTSAQVELEAEIDKEIARRIADNNTYEFDSNPVDFFNQGMDVVVGQSVHFSFGGSTLETRVLMVEKRLDGIYQQRIRIGNEQIKGVTQELKEDVADANQSIDVIKAFNELSSALSNAYANAQREMIEGFAAIKNMWQFDKDNENTIFSAFNVYSKGWMSAKGIDKGEEGSGAGSTTIGGLTNVGSWADQTADYDRIMVQIAGSNTWTEKRLDEIGGGLDEEQLAAYLTENNYAKIVDIPSLDGYATQSWVLGKGYATTSDLDSRIDALVNGAPAAFDTLKEIADVLQGNVDSIGDILTTLGTKADKSISILAGTGLAGGGTLSANRTLSLKPATTSALGGIIVGDRLSVDSSGRLTATYTYTHPSATATTIAAATGKVLSAITVNSLGHVTSVAAKTLAAADIPSLAISKIAGLQDELDKKLDASVLNDLFEKVTVNGVTAIRAKYGLFTNEFLSAKGMDEGEEGGSGSSYLSDLLDVSLTSLATNDLLKWNGTKWINVPQSSIVPSLVWGNITGKPTTLAGYGITDAYTKTEADNRYVDVSGDTMEGALVVKMNNQGARLVGDYTGGWLQLGDMSSKENDQNGTISGFNGSKLTSLNVLINNKGFTIDGNIVWHEGNDGAGSGLDADLLDGSHKSELLTSLSSNTTTNFSITVGGTTKNISSIYATYLDGLRSSAFARADQSPLVDLDSVNGIGIMTNSLNANATTDRHYPIQEAGSLIYATAAYSSANQIYGSYNTNRWFARGGGNSVTSKTAWREFAFTDSNVASATKLQTARTIWGRLFDGTNNVTGSLVDVIDITMSGNLSSSGTLYSSGGFWLNDNLGRFFYDKTSGRNWLQSGAGKNLSISALNSSYISTLDIYATISNFLGGITAQQYIQVGDGRIYWDATNKALYVKGSDGTAIGFYSNGWMSAKGVDEGEESGSSGDGMTEKQMWEYLADAGTEQIALNHLTTALTGYATQSWVNSQGFLTSIPTHNHSWANITSGKPTTLSGYGITDGVNTITISGSGNAVSDITLSGHTLTVKKTNISGSGSTGGVTAINISGSGNAVTTANLSGNTLTLTKGSNFLLATGNAASASKLQTSRTFWGQSFDGTNNVQGSMSNVDWITFSRGTSNRYLELTNEGSIIFHGASSNWVMGLVANGYSGANLGNSAASYGSGNSLIYHYYGGTYNSPVVVINSARNFGYGTTAPSSNFHIVGNSRFEGEFIAFYTGSKREEPIFKFITYPTNPYGLLIRYYNSGATSLQSQRNTNNSECFSLLLNPLGGNVGIGTTSPTAKLHVNGNIAASNVSDLRLKTIIDKKTDYRRKLMGLGQVVDFYYNDKAFSRKIGEVDKEKHIGLIYQSAIKMELSKFCHMEEDGYGSINYLSADYINLIAGALQQTIGIQEDIVQRVIRLEKENEELKCKLNRLSA